MKSHTFVFLGLVLLLAGCGGSSPSQLYTLMPDSTPTPTLYCRTPVGIKLLEPSVLPGLESNHIVVIDRPNHQTYYRGVAWNTTAPHAVQAYVMEAFERSKLFSNVSTDTDSASAPWVLETRLRGLAVDQTGAHPEAVTKISMTLIRASDHKPVVSEVFERHDDASGLNMDAIVAVFNRQLGSISQEMLEHVVAAGACERHAPRDQ